MGVIVVRKVFLSSQSRKRCYLSLESQEVSQENLLGTQNNVTTNLDTYKYNVIID